MRIKTTTYSDVRQRPCQFYWHGLLHFTIIQINKGRSASKAPTVARLRSEIKQREHENSEKRHFYSLRSLFLFVHFKSSEFIGADEL
jgi:hypothetical protein